MKLGGRLLIKSGQRLKPQSFTPCGEYERIEFTMKRDHVSPKRTRSGNIVESNEGESQSHEIAPKNVAVHMGCDPANIVG